jgi:hypothetical protein
MRAYRFLPVLLWLLVPASLDGQSAAFSINVENDIFNLLNQTDRYYTSGLSVAAYHKQLNNSPFNAILIGQKSGKQLTGISIRQGIYTPTDIYTNELLIGDRPYASYLLLGQQRITVNPGKTYRIKSELGVGVLGEYSGGQTLQNFIHGLTPHSANANGWQHQINHDFALIYGLQLEKGLFNTNWFLLNVLGNIQAGTLLNRSDIGLAVHTGYFEDYFGTPLGVSGHANFNIRFFVEANLAYVFYDATLQGGVFNTGDSYIISNNEMQNQRFNYRFGVQFSYKKVNLEAGRIWETQEFNGAEDHGWGYIKLQILIP